MKKSITKRLVSLLMTVALLLSLAVAAVPASALESAEPAEESGGSFVNVSEDGGEDYINLCVPRSFEAVIPVDMTEEEAQAAAESAVWSLIYDEAAGYLDPELYPNHTTGGTIDSFTALNEEALFSEPVTTVEVVDGQVCLKVSFDSYLYFYNSRTGEDGETVYTADYSVPHSNGGSYLDVCGYYDLCVAVDGETLGGVEVKITPYDNFHTMQEIYDAIEELVAYGQENTDLYIEEFSMGSSQGDNGLESLDMPYIIIAKDQDAVLNWLSLKEEAESDPTSVIEKIESGELTDYQVPVMYSNIHSNEVSASDAVLGFAELLVEAAAGDGTIDYNTLTGFTEEGEAELAAQMGAEGEQYSVAVPDLVADTATYLGYIKAEGSSVSAAVDLDTYYTQETVTVDIDELLEDVFFILVPEENVEGRTYVTRTSSGGFDLNRDNSFQTQAETQNMTQLIAMWNPVSFTEFHGRVQTFQCEPCDPPHEPNFEYDLLAEHLMTGGEAFGIAAVANNDSYNSYVIPQRDYLSYTGELTEDGEYETCWYDPWDDMSTSYTPQYAMLHGTVAYTVEVPAYNDDVVQAVVYGQLGQSNYIAQNKESYFLCQLQIFERGVTNANSDAYELVGQWFCDVYDVEGAESDLFRPEYDGEGQNGNFYPECYIIPLDSEHQSNLQAADEMLTYLVRNGVTIQIADEAFAYDGVEYPAGTAVVSMYQAKRSVANGVLYDGTVITEWPVLYSEGITAFNMTRGFDMVVCAEPAAYEIIEAAVSDSDTWTVASDVVSASQVIINNTSEAAVAAVNALLKEGKSVSLITEGDNIGSFLVSLEDYESVSADYLLTAQAVEGEAPASQALTKAPVVYISGEPEDNTSGFVKSTLVSGSYEYNYDRQAMEILGFEVTDDASEADLIIGAAALDEQALEAVKSGTPYIGYGRRAIASAVSLFEDGTLVRETVSSNSMDALGYVTYPADSLITASYVAEGDYILYGYGAGYFSVIPDGAEILVQMDGSQELLEGFLNSDGEHYEDFLNDSIQAIAYEGEGADGATLNVVLFANTLTNKVHQRDEFGFIANAAFAAVLAD
ncbi:MAG: M14 family metallopeptidase [Oscillospiraceae bacterium]|nr:M14 family metallopeptidase [Oscillospiraceae bacterium]